MILFGFVAILAYIPVAITSPLNLPVPDGCPLPDTPILLQNLTWTNGSRAIRCNIDGPVFNDNEGCLSSSEWSDPTNCTEEGGHRVGLCATGLTSYQPWGYGPQPELFILFRYGNETGGCYERFKGYRDSRMGEGDVHCSPTNYIFGYDNKPHAAFWGKTDFPTYVARMEAATPELACANGSKIFYAGAIDFKLKCDHDQWWNATCRAAALEVPVTKVAYATASSASYQTFWTAPTAAAKTSSV